MVFTLNVGTDILYLSIVLLGLVGNVLLFALLLRHPLKSRCSNVLMLVQCVLDGALCLMSALQTTLHETVDPNTNVVACFLWRTHTIYWGLLGAIAANLSMLAVDRFEAVCGALHYRRHETLKLVLFMSTDIVFALVNAVLALPFFRYDSTDGCAPDGSSIWVKVYTVVYFLTNAGFPVATFCVCFPLVALKLRNQEKTVPTANVVDADKSSTGGGRASNTNSHTPTTSHRLRLRQSTRFTVLCILVSLLFSICVPYDGFYLLLAVFGVVDFQQYLSSLMMNTILVAFNSCVHLLVYLAMMRHARNMLLDTVTCGKAKFVRGLVSGTFSNTNHNSSQTIGSRHPSQQPSRQHSQAGGVISTVA